MKDRFCLSASGAFGAEYLQGSRMAGDTRRNAQDLLTDVKWRFSSLRTTAYNFSWSLSLSLRHIGLRILVDLAFFGKAPVLVFLSNEPRCDILNESVRKPISLVTILDI